jgi:predicted kinase
LVIVANVTELIIFSGIQAAGKSTYYREHFAATHVLVSKDLMKSVRDRDVRQLQMIDVALSAGKSVVIDNTNPTPLVRAPLIAAARRHGARIIGYFFQVPVKLAIERNRAREGKARVPDVAIYATSRKLVPPNVEEGFDEIHIVDTPQPNAEKHS